MLFSIIERRIFQKYGRFQTGRFEGHNNDSEGHNDSMRIKFFALHRPTADTSSRKKFQKNKAKRLKEIDLNFHVLKSLQGEKIITSWGNQVQENFIFRCPKGFQQIYESRGNKLLLRVH